MSELLRLSMDALLLALALRVGGGMALASALGPAAPGAASGPVLVIAPPWAGTAAELVRRAGGAPVGPVTAPFGALAVFDSAAPVDRLLALGAWTVRDARSIASLCGGDA
ncbi:MAG: hypothetical protein GYB50_23265 [Rhodobacteraceae bacterium]|nr:hypothetical protein [Paracoccaceae bacterium]